MESRECGLAVPCFPFTEAPRSGEADFITAESSVPTMIVHYPSGQKPRIWSLAHTAAASAVEGAPSTTPRAQSPECHTIPRQPISIRRLLVPRDSTVEEDSLAAKAFGNSTFALQGLPLNCAPCPRRREPEVRFQYPSGAEGSGTPEALGVPVQKIPTCHLPQIWCDTVSKSRHSQNLKPSHKNKRCGKNFPPHDVTFEEVNSLALCQDPASCPRSGRPIFYKHPWVQPVLSEDFWAYVWLISIKHVREVL